MPKNVKDIETLGEIVRLAHDALDQNAWDYLIGGSETETSVLRNRLALDELAFRPRVLVDVRNIDITKRFLDFSLRMPVILGPIGGLEMFDPGGAATVAKAARAFGVTSMVSSVGQPGMEETVRQSEADLIFQLYVRGDEDWVKDHIRRAEDIGYKAFCLTVDTAVYSRRERDKIKDFNPRAGRKQLRPEFQAAFDWAHVAKIRERCTMPLILKGIATHEDARLAIEHGIDAVHVSNHGGRQLDHGRGMMEALPEIADAVGGKAAIIIDGSFCRGSDVLKALALGADVVALARLYGWGLAAGGQAGVERVLELLEIELQTDMALLGVTGLDQLGPEFIAKSRAVRRPGLFSAFPHLHIPEYDYSRHVLE
ncbi:MAG: alpha-hydroxy-acid oxidizing protein [Rhodospirillales bacterium]|nr:alpha-hydroxy-acid oxidizing protein [Rhodospirillales bacterium]